MDLIPLFSLVVAALAIFVGPMLSDRTAKRAMLGPMRQQWINDFRALLAEVSSRCLHYFNAGYVDRTDEEYQHIADLEHRIIFMINPNEPEHQALVQVIRNMISALEKCKDGDEEFIASYEQLLRDGRAILKKEWNVVKEA